MILLTGLLKKKQMTGGNVTEESDKFNRGLDLFIESVLKPDHKLRECAHNQKCYHELMYIRSYVLDYLSTLRQH
jgi:hypothetical protein